MNKTPRIPRPKEQHPVWFLFWGKVKNKGKNCVSISVFSVSNKYF